METNTEPVDPLNANVAALVTQPESKNSELFWLIMCGQHIPLIRECHFTGRWNWSFSGVVSAILLNLPSLMKPWLHQHSLGRDDFWPQFGRKWEGNIREFDNDLPGFIVSATVSFLWRGFWKFSLLSLLGFCWCFKWNSLFFNFYSLFMLPISPFLLVIQSCFCDNKLSITVHQLVKYIKVYSTYCWQFYTAQHRTEE